MFYTFSLPPHLALNPPYILFLFYWGGGLFLPFFSLLFNPKTGFPPRKGHLLFIFESLPLFLLRLFWPPSFSISLDLSLSCSFLFFFILVFSFLLSFGSLFWSISFLLFLLCVCFRKGTTTSKHLIAISFFINLFSFLDSCLVFSFNPFSYLCSFLILSYVFCSRCMFLVSKQTTLKTQIFGQEGGLQQNVFLNQPVFCKMWKVTFFFGALFWANFGWCSNNTIKIGISAHF